MGRGIDGRFPSDSTRYQLLTLLKPVVPQRVGR